MKIEDFQYYSIENQNKIQSERRENRNNRGGFSSISITPLLTGIFYLHIIFRSPREKETKVHR